MLVGENLLYEAYKTFLWGKYNSLYAFEPWYSSVILVVLLLRLEF